MLHARALGGARVTLEVARPDYREGRCAYRLRASHHQGPRYDHQGFTLTHEKAAAVFGEVCAIDADDGLSFELLRTEDIRDVDEYPGIRVFLTAHYAPLAVPVAIDVTTGDRITPNAVCYEYPLAFDEGTVRIMAYPLETVLAEKLETILSRNVATTRIRDFYDIYELWWVKRELVDSVALGAALVATCEKRNSLGVIGRCRQAIEAMRIDLGLNRVGDAAELAVAFIDARPDWRGMPADGGTPDFPCSAETLTSECASHLRPAVLPAPSHHPPVKNPPSA